MGKESALEQLAENGRNLGPMNQDEAGNVCMETFNPPQGLAASLKRGV